MKHHHIAFSDSIAVDFDSVHTILLAVRLADSVGRQLSRLAHRHEASAQIAGKHSATDKATRLDADNIGDLLPAILQGLESYKIDVGTPFFVKYGRVGVMDEISELTGATVTCTLIGERPGLITAESMSAYIAYKATVGMPEARRTVVSNIHRAGTIPAEAGAHIAEIIKIMLDKKASGTDLKL